MKTYLKSLVIAAVLVVGGSAIETASAQRNSGGGGSRPSRSSSPGFSRGGSTTYNRSAIRPSYSYRVPRTSGSYQRSRYYYARPGYGSVYRRPYYGRYYSYYRPYLGFSLRALPFGYYPFFFGDVQFYYSGGLYYRQFDDEYKVVVPPVGAEVPKIPSNAQSVTVNGQVYYEYKGVYYKQSENAEGKKVYVIAGKDGVLNTDEKIQDPNDSNADNPPDIKIGDIVNELPESAKEVTLKGERYYVSDDGVYYEEVISGDKITYRVVGL